MKAEEFWKRFKNLFSEGSQSSVDARKYWKNPREFTNNFVNEYIPEIIKEENDTTEFEYFRIDIIAYSQRRDEAKAYGYDFKKLKPHLWDLKVAFEHENDKTEWLDEVIKLSHIRCPLRIVVCYFTPGEERAKALEFAAAMLCKKIGKNVAKNEEFLLIIGSSGTRATQVNASTYTPYLYQSGEFIMQNW